MHNLTILLLLFACTRVFSVVCPTCALCFLGQSLKGAPINLLNLTSYCETDIFNCKTNQYIICNGTKTITGLNFSNSFITGYIPTQLGNLDTLTYLNFANNHILGKIPTQLGKLTSLQYLNLAYSYITGEIPTQISNMPLQYLNISNTLLISSLPPQIGKISNLKILDINSQKVSSYIISGVIPSQIGKLINLEYFDIGGNGVSYIPPQIGNLESLTYLNLYHGIFNGTVPTSLGKLRSLQYLYFDGYFNGSLPTELGLLTNLTSVQFLIRNTMEGPIPKHLGNLTSLKSLTFFDNGGPSNFISTIPTQFGKLKSIEIMDLNMNYIYGTIPTQFANLNNLHTLKIRYTMVNGTIPKQLGSLKLDYLALEGNNINGTIIKQIGNITNIKTLVLSDNYLSGTVPSTLFQLSNLSILNLNLNNLNGIFPPEIGNLSSIVTLWCSSNYLSGTLPSQLGKLTNLQDLTIQNNMFSGVIPTQLSKLPNLQILNLYHNEFNVLPTEIITMKKLKILNVKKNELSLYPIFSYTDLLPSSPLATIDLSYNQLSGSIPRIISENLQYMDVSNNILSGTFPQSLDFPKIAHLDLSLNYNISGILPNLVDSLFLTYLDVNYNLISGNIPTFENSKSLRELKLNDNLFSGTLPSILPISLRFLWLQNNKLEGTIPSSYGNMEYLLSLDFSNLNICGCWPENWVYHKWETCLMNSLKWNINYCPNITIPQGCTIAETDETVICGDPNPCSNNNCNPLRSCIADDVAGYTCGDCHSSLYSKSGRFDCKIYSFMYYILGAVGVVIIILIIIGSYKLSKRKEYSYTKPLPDSHFWDLKNVTDFKKIKNYYKKKLNDDSADEWILLNSLKRLLDFPEIKTNQGFEIKASYAIPSPILAQITTLIFNIQQNITIDEIKNAKNYTRTDFENYTLDYFIKKLESNDTCKNENMPPVIPMVYATTDRKIAWDIVAEGKFEKQDGDFGRGIYFSSSAQYLYKDDLYAFLICYTLPGKPQMKLREDDTQKLSPNETSFYVVVKKDGSIYREEDFENGIEESFDVLVIPEVRQVVPLFLLKLNPKRHNVIDLQ